MHDRQHMRRRRRQGFTIIEVVIAGILLSFLVIVAFMAYGHSSEVMGQSLVLGDAASRADHLENRLLSLLRDSGNQQLSADATKPTVGLPYNTLTFNYTSPIDPFDDANNTVQYAWGDLDSDGSMGGGESLITRTITWVAQNDIDQLSGEGAIVLLENGQILETLGEDVMDINMDFYDGNGNNSNQQTPSTGDTELRLFFTLRVVMGADSNGQKLTRDERRVVRLMLRNQ